jgi:DNA recombination protein RmuC
MEIILYIVIAVIIGGVIGWLLVKAKITSTIQADRDIAQQQYSELDKEFVGYRATTSSELRTGKDNLDEKLKEIAGLKDTLHANELDIYSLNKQISTANADLRAANQTITDKNSAVEVLKEELKTTKAQLDESCKALATANANNEALNEKLQTQKEEIEKLGKKFNTEFENIANKILDTKTEKFTELNKTNLKTILEPLGKNITEFKIKVEEVYDKESKERFSLGEKVKELAQLNKVISEEAHNLTKALKNESKTQGGWGEMILENILERSGLVKDREYFMEHQLLDENGIPMKTDSEDKKMRPDAVIKYPDNRNVIIDSKVSLNAFTRCIAAIDEESRLSELAEHASCIKKHIISLSAKGYDDYNKSLDFVMLFIPSEPAYIAALQGDPDLWNFAYDKRILLLSPTNLITSLKLIVDLWKREYQNQNALEIAERGAKLYDKFVGFVANLDDVGVHLEKAQGKYTEAYKQLSTGNDNLVIQATKLKSLGLKTKKELPKEIINTAIGNGLPEQTIE